MLAAVGLAQTRLARHPATAAQVAGVTAAQRQDQTGRQIRAVVVVVHKPQRAGLAAPAS
jgi:hypothetical protein